MALSVLNYTDNKLTEQKNYGEFEKTVNGARQWPSKCNYKKTENVIVKYKF